MCIPSPTSHQTFVLQLQRPVLPPFGQCRVQWESFDDLRLRVEAEWAALPPATDVLSAPLREKRAEVAARLGVQGQVPA